MATNQDTLNSVIEKANAWLTDVYDEETRKEVQRMLDQEDKTELIDSFYKQATYFEMAYST
ncbi:MAG: hypothetical protein MI892_15220 [Desulfobacterales bacterium]|nr:hypothetical protein [Desulfobacterales bacterium]